MVSGLLATLLSLCVAVGFGFWVQYRKAMNRAYRAVQGSQKRVLDAAQAERDQTDAEIGGLDGDDLSSAVDAAFPGSKPDLSSDDAD